MALVLVYVAQGSQIIGKIKLSELCSECNDKSQCNIALEDAQPQKMCLYESISSGESFQIQRLIFKTRLEAFAFVQNKNSQLSIEEHWFWSGRSAYRAPTFWESSLSRADYEVWAKKNDNYKSHFPSVLSGFFVIKNPITPVSYWQKDFLGISSTDLTIVHRTYASDLEGCLLHIALAYPITDLLAWKSQNPELIILKHTGNIKAYELFLRLHGELILMSVRNEVAVFVYGCNNPSYLMQETKLFLSYMNWDE
jgi:hypothetical protein